MPLDLTVVGVQSEPVERSWTSKDTLLYALGVGAGQSAPTDNLAFTTENSHGVAQKVLPTFGVLAAQVPRTRRIGEFNPAMLVHAEQSLELHASIPTEGTVSVSSTVTGIYDKGTGALVTTKAQAVETETGEPMVTTHSSVFIRGEGGFGGDPGPTHSWKRPSGEPDHQVVYPTRSDQALLYRLSGDRNPLHSDPDFASQAGFNRPILHGLCTYGVTGRALLHTVCESDPERFVSMAGRFTKAVFPGQELVISIWIQKEIAIFQTALPDGTVVIDHGVLGFR